MNLSEVFIRRPIATSLLMAAIALFGVLAYNTLSISDLPNVAFPTINVNANLPGADPATMASTVATVLERQFTTIAGIDSMTSNSGTGNTNITLQFSQDRDIDSAAADVQTAIAAALPLLPAGMPFPPSFRKANPADQPVMFLTIQSATLPMSVLNDYAENLIVPRLSTISGVAQVQINGRQKYAVRVQVDPDKLVAKRIGLNEVNAAIATWNPNLPTGTLYGPRQTYTVKTNAELHDAAQFANVVVAWRNGAPVRLGDIADVIDSVEDTLQATWNNSSEFQERAIQMSIQRQAGGNDIAIADTVRAILPEIQAQIPPAAKLTIRSDRSRLIRQTFADTRVTLVLALGLAVVVIFLFLRNLSATIIPAMALPFSLLGTLTIMALCGYTLDNLSMIAIILSVAFVMDDAIVMLENIMRHVETGMRPLEAALEGSREICFTILSMTVTLAAVFIPILFMGGILGRLFREFAVTIAAAVLVSGFVSISLTPMLCSRFLRVRSKGQQGWLSRALDWPFQRMRQFYGWSLRGVLRVRPLMALLFVGVLVATGYLFQVVPKGFIPDEDQDFMNVNVRAAQGTSFYQMVEHARRVADVLRQDPDIDVFLSNVGNGNNSNFNVMLKPRSQRKAGVQEIIDRNRPKMARFPGIQVSLNGQPAIRIGGRQSNSNYQFTLQGADLAELYQQAEIMEAEIGKLPEVNDVSTDLQRVSPRQTVKIDRERAALYGLNPNQIQNALYSAYGPQIVSTIYTPASQYRVLEEMKPSYQSWVDYLSKIYFKSSSGQLVPLDSLAKVTPDIGPQSIAHSGQLPSVTVSFNVKTGVALGTAVQKVTDLADRLMPATVTARFSGNAQAFQDSLQNLTLLLIIAIGVVYIVLGVLYESYIHPLTILSGLPSAGVGALLTLMLFKQELNIYSFVGLIMLIGIVQKNGIMQTNFALDAERRLGLSPVDAVYEGCMIRFRPIMMTTMAALFTAVPLAMGGGNGGEARRPIGLAVMGGLIFSQLMTLYLTPVMYTYMSGVIHWMRSRKRPRTVAPPTAEPVHGYGD